MFFYLIVTLLFFVYYVTTRKYDYWKIKNVPHIKPTFILGNYGKLYLRKQSFGTLLQELCNRFPDEKFFGAFYGTEPVLIPKDPDIIKLIVTKDFYYFNGRELTDQSYKNPLAMNLFSTYGDNWRVLRQNMTPLFSSAKMKAMFHIIKKCCYVFESMLDRETTISKELELRTLTSRYTIECIGACGFGVDANAMTEEENDNPFRKMAKSIDQLKYFVILKVIHSICPSLFFRLGLNPFARQIPFFKNFVTSVMTQRQYKSSERNDFIDLILSWKQKRQIVGDSIQSIKTGKSDQVSLAADDDLLIAQCILFYNAGFDSSSTTLSYTLYELAKNEDTQNKVLVEIDTFLARHENKLSYDCVSELPYLDACIDEALRLYPALGMIPRLSMETYTLPGGVQIEKGLRVHLPVYYMHHDPKFYPEPEAFRPERFIGEEKRKINPYAYLPFGEGPRMCIGIRFAKMQILAGLVTILKKYRLELADGMPRTLKFKPDSLVTHPVIGIRLTFIERDGWENRVFVK